MTPAPGAAVAGTFAARLKTALVGDPAARFVYVNNFEVERAWGRDETRLPGTGFSFSSATVNRMEEVGVLLADEPDVVVLKAPVDPAYAAYLDALGAAAGTRLSVDHNEPDRSITADALASPRLLAELSAMAGPHTYLMPLGISPDEERLAEAVGMPLAGPSARVCKLVNGKIFSRELVDAAGLTRVPGAACRTLKELRAALQDHPPGEGRRVVVKESLGVSGRGMVVLDSPHRAERLLRMVERRDSGGPLHVVVERWIDKRCDLNYQFIVGRDGRVVFETVKTALTENGVHRGHVFPAPLRSDQIAQLRAAAEMIGGVLAHSGYYGLVGVDALLGADDTLYPCLEINARFNMATYQNRITERFLRPGRHALATVFDLRPSRVHSFEEVRAALGPLLLREPGPDPTGVLINNFATLNAGITPGRPSHGRIYAICIGADAQQAADTAAAAHKALIEMVTA